MNRQWSPETASNLRAELARANKRKGDLATFLGLSPAAITRRVNGETPLDVDELCAVAAWLDIPLTRLLPERVNPTTSGLSGGNRAVVDMLVAA